MKKNIADFVDPETFDKIGKWIDENKIPNPNGYPLLIKCPYCGVPFNINIRGKTDEKERDI